MAPEPPPSVSVIATVYNEQQAITRLLDSLAAQTRVPDQVVIVDGGSQDETMHILEQRAARDDLNLDVYAVPGCNISTGRNAAISAAQGRIIAVTDAGVELEPDWLENLVRPFSQDASVQVASGFFVPAPETVFERAMGATVLPALADINPQTFLPSSRSVAFNKSAWQAIGGYPEWLDYCEDLILDLELRERFGPFAFVPDAVVHFRPRSSLRAFFIQYYRYARGDGKAKLWPKKHAIRYLTYGVLIPVLLWLAVRHSAWWLAVGLLGSIVYTAAPYRRLIPQLSKLRWGERLYAVALVPILRVVGDIAKMIGYPVGRIWRRQHQQEIP